MKLFEARRPATLEEVSWLRKALGRQLGELRLPGDVAGEMVLAVAELAANLVAHSDPPPRELAVEAVLDGILLTVTLEDDGGPFAGFETRWARATLAGAEDGVSGRGLALARRALDAVSYHRGPPNRLVAHRRLARRRPVVLVVEDEDVLLETYLGLLEPHFRLLAAANLKDALDIDGIYDSIRNAGLDLPERPRASDLNGKVVNCFMKCEADRTGQLRGRRQIMLDDSDVSWHRHIKAAVGGVA
ncbi:MAG: hypothetical protein B7X76_02225, partial [Azorhizobium sp. 39-67-5]